MSFRRVLRNVVSSWVGYAATLLVGFFLSPLVVHSLGAAGYGVWTLVVSLTGYCGLLDLGLRSSVVRFVVRYVAQNDHKKVNATLSSALAMLTGAGILAFVVTVVIHFTFGMSTIDPGLRSAAQVALLITGLNVSLILPLSVFSAILPSIERFDVMNAITVCGALLRAVLVVTVLKSGHGIVALSMVTLGVSSAEYATMAIAARALYPALRLSWHSIDAASCRELFGFGLFRFVWIVANQLIFYTDSVVIGVFLNASAITSYAIAGSLINYGRNIVSLAIDTLFPAVTRFHTKNDLAGLRRIYILGTRIGLLMGFSLCIGYVFFGRSFIHLWMGENYYISSATILFVLTLPQFASMPQYMSALVLLGTARHKLLALIAVGEAIINLCLSIVLVQRMGVIGVAWGTALPHIITTALVLPYFTLRAVDMKLGDYLRRTYVMAIVCAIPTGLTSYALARFNAATTWYILVIDLSVQCALFGLLSYFICLSRDERGVLRDTVIRIIRRQRTIGEEMARATGT